MKVSLLYNKNAGDGVPLDHIRNSMAEHGHQLVRVIDKHTDVERLLDEFPDIVVAAGGDGTVALAARTLARRGIPLAILPLGTANNIAKSLGTAASIDDVIGGWETAMHLPLDLGVADGMWGRRHFVEAVGGGLIPSAIAEMQSRSDGDELPARSKIAGAIRGVSQLFSRLKPGEWTVVVDGVRMIGEFLLVEVLNIRLVGPNLVFSAEANPSDGLFRVVMAGEEHRQEIVAYLRDLLEGRGHPPSLPSQSARQVTLQGPTDIHVDDQVLPRSPDQAVSIRVEVGALEFLA